MIGWMEERSDGWVDGWMDGGKEEWMDGWMDGCREGVIDGGWSNGVKWSNGKEME